jgi:hypothetical protein
MRLSAVLGFSALVSTLLLTGCSSFQTTASSSSLERGASVQGHVHGGQQPIVGAHVYLMAANTNGYGGASVSLLDGTATGQSDSIGAYVLTDAQGGFSISGDYSCTAAQQVYLLAVGGDAGAGNNSSSSLMAVLGQCPSGSTNFAAAVPFISVNEVTTVAGAYALSGYMTDMLHVSSSGTALANIGMANAFVTAANLANISSGSANATTPAGNGTVPQSKINTLANILAACINSDGTVVSTPIPTNCYTLFSNATSDGTANGTQPTETVTAALNMAHHPGANVASLFALAPSSAPFQPVLSSVNDLTLALKFTGGGLIYPTDIAVDSYGNVWASNDSSSINGVVVAGNSASKFAAGTGAAVSPTGTGYTGGGINVPDSIAIDTFNNVWIGDQPTNVAPQHAYLTKLASDGTPVSTIGYDLGYSGPTQSIAIDGSGNAFAFNAGIGELVKVDGLTGVATPLVGHGTLISSSMAMEPNGDMWVSTVGAGVIELDTTGAIIVTTGVGSGIESATSVAIDHSGNVWVANGGTYYGSQTYGLAKFSSNGALLSPPSSEQHIGGYDDLVRQGPVAIAIDGAGRVFVLHNFNIISELNNDGSLVTTYAGYTDSSLNTPNSMAVDGSGNAWVANFHGSSLTEFVGLAVPVVTPIAAGVANNTLGTRP